MSTRFKQIQFNIIHMTYLSPKRLHAIYPARESQCPRCNEDDILHMLWCCLAVTTFWGEIVTQIKWAKGWYISLQIYKCLLGLLPDDLKHKLNRIYTVAKRSIAIHWMSDGPLTSEKWEKDLRVWTGAEEEHIYERQEETTGCQRCCLHGEQ